MKLLCFCGEERCSVDGNGRVRLPQRFADEFRDCCGGNVVLLGLPEGGIGIYPEKTYREMRQREIGDPDQIGHSFAARRSLRRFGLLSSPQELSAQGRVSVPGRLQEHAALLPGGEVSVIGVEVGVELWSRERLEKELQEIDAHMKEKCARDMETDLQQQGRMP